jgi:hypothetical protein
MSEEIRVCGSLKLKEVDGEMAYYLTFCQGLLPHFLEQKQINASNTSRSPSNKRATSSLAQPRGQGARRKYKFKEEDDDLICITANIIPTLLLDRIIIPTLFLNVLSFIPYF